MATDVNVIQKNGAIVRTSLSQLQQLESNINSSSTSFYDVSFKYNNVVDNVEYWGNQALDNGGLNSNDKWRITNKIYSKGVNDSVEVYKDNAALYDIMKNYVRWVGELGSNPPEFGDRIGNTVESSYVHLRRGVRTDISDSITGTNFHSKEYDSIKATVRHSVENVDDYIASLDNELQKMLVLDVTKFLPKYDPLADPNVTPDVYTTKVEMQAEILAKNAVKQIYINNVQKEIRFWKRVKKYVTVVDDVENNTYHFNGLEYVSNPLTFINFSVSNVWFDNTNKDYVIEVLFDAVPDLEEIFNIGNYKVNQGLLINTVTLDGYTADEVDQKGILEVNHKKVILRSKFVIMPNNIYTLTLSLPNLSLDHADFNRTAYPIPDRVMYFSDNEIHIRFKPNIDLISEGISGVAHFALNIIQVKLLSNYKIIDSAGNNIGIKQTYLESDEQTISIILQNSMVDRNGYNVILSGLYYETGGLLRSGYNTITFAFSDPYPLGSVVGLYDASHDVNVIGWLPSVQSDISGYNIYRSQVIGGNNKYFKLNNNITNQTRFVDFTAEYGKSYNYTVTVVDMLGAESFASNIVTLVKA